MKPKSFTITEQEAIEEKIEQLIMVKKGLISAKDLSDMIAKRRINWIMANADIIKRYNHLRPEEKAHKIIFLEHMKINPGHSEVIRLEEGAIRINSYNFCPYLIASLEVGLDTKFVCKEINEQSIIQMCKMIHPSLTFMRDYSQTRPRFPHFCREYIIDKNPIQKEAPYAKRLSAGSVNAVACFNF